MIDKRLLVVETELVSAFKVAARDGNTLSPVIRQAWETGTLRTLTRNNPLTATDAHISIIGHITSEELLRHLTSTEIANGFANRFLWFTVRRSRFLPDGGNFDPAIRAGFVQRVQAAISSARRVAELERDAAARDLWHQEYEGLSAGEPGLVGALLARSEAQVLRLSMLYALLDRERHVRERHLQAALALWEASARSVRFLFGDQTGDPDADVILRSLRVGENGGLSRTEISRLFGRHASADRIERACAVLLANGTATVEREETRGRPTERWRAVISRISPTSPSITNSDEHGTSGLNSLSSLVSRPHSWPQGATEDAYHGLLGELVGALEPHTEADPQAILVQLLVAFGNAVGRTPYYAVEADRHHSNLFAVLVGDTAKARKGTSWGHARRILTEADPGGSPGSREASLAVRD